MDREGPGGDVVGAAELAALLWAGERCEKPGLSLLWGCTLTPVGEGCSSCMRGPTKAALRWPGALEPAQPVRLGWAPGAELVGMGGASPARRSKYLGDDASLFTAMASAAWFATSLRP